MVLTGNMDKLCPMCCEFLHNHMYLTHTQLTQRSLLLPNSLASNASLIAGPRPLGIVPAWSTTNSIRRSLKQCANLNSRSEIFLWRPCCERHGQIFAVFLLEHSDPELYQLTQLGRSDDEFEGIKASEREPERPMALMHGRSGQIHPFVFKRDFALEQDSTDPSSRESMVRPKLLSHLSSELKSRLFDL